MFDFLPVQGSTLKKLLWLRKVTGGSSLPAEYREVLGFTYAANTYYQITNFKMYGTYTTRVSFMCTEDPPARNVLGAQSSNPDATTNNYSLHVGSSAAKLLRYNGGTYSSYVLPNKRYDVVITPTGSLGLEVDSTWAKKSFRSEYAMCVGATSTSSTRKFVGSIYGHIVIDGYLNLIPCERLSDHVLGYYDTVNETFYEPIGDPPTEITA